jgi:predicted anti-sigma-YlaC factor YlaD
MNTCEHFEILVSTWLDSQLDRRGQVECLDHLARCASCREFYVEARALDGLVAAVRTPADAEAPSPEVWKRIEWVSRKERKRPARRRIPAWALQAAAVVVVTVGLSVLVWNGIGVAPAPAQAEILLGSDTDMTETRFVELTREVLQADRRYHAAMFLIMEQVVRDTAGRGETFVEEAVQRTDEGEVSESAESAGLAPA